MSKNESDEKDITKDTKKKSNEKTENDTTAKRKSWTRNCPKCNRTIFHKTAGSRNTCNRKKYLCRSCGNVRPKIITQTQWERNCPKCNKVITHKNVISYKASIRTQRICVSCKMSEQVDRLFKSKPKPVYIRYCPTCNKEILYKSKWSMTKANNKNRKCRSCTVKENSKHRKFDREHLSKLRNNYLEILRKRKGQLTPNYNVNACQIFEEINKEMEWNGQHAENGGEKFVDGYWVDYYEPTLNLVIEYDEKDHRYKAEKDRKRQEDIIKYLNCKFIRIEEGKDWRDIITKNKENI